MTDGYMDVDTMLADGNREEPFRADGRLKIALLGSSGSIGTQTVDVVQRNAQHVEIVALAVHSSVDTLVKQALCFGVKHLAVGDESMEGHPALLDLPSDVRVGFGSQAVCDLCDLDQVDMVFNALVGAAGLRASYQTLASGRALALANKESLVVGGDLIMPLATKRTLLPVDSEHSAIYQCYLGEDPREARRIWLTASGGPFRGRTRANLTQVTCSEALAHPTWTMGPKITIDSSTLMNKGLEAIEAHHLFAVDYDAIKIVVHPQSCIHSMVEYCDGSVKAHLGTTDMRIPIQFALSYPHRWEAPVTPVDFTELGTLSFEEPDLQTFGCLRLALEAGRMGGTMPAVLNAANEVAVAAFLNKRGTFLDIERCVEATMERHETQKVISLEQLENIDADARITAAYYFKR